MEEKYMVNDILECIKNEILVYTKIITNIENIEFRQILQTIRSNLESFEFEILNLAISKGYYFQISKIKPEELEKIKSSLSIL